MLLIADTTVISNFFLIGRLDLLEGIKDLCATKEVWDELEVANKRGILEISQTDLKAEILRMNEDETESFLRLCSRFGRGEASCLAIALHRDAGILTDDLDARRFAQRGNIPVSGSIGILVKCVTNGHLSLEQGNELLSQMIQKGFFSPVESLDRFLL
jgi:predicted nucleic acid-binding protein